MPPKGGRDPSEPHLGVLDAAMTYDPRGVVCPSRTPRCPTSPWCAARAAVRRDAEELAEPAERPTGVDLERVWEERRARFAAGFPDLSAVVRVREPARAALVARARQVHAERPDGDGWLRVELDFGGLDHALAMVRALGPDAEALGPESLRKGLAARAVATAAHHTRRTDRSSDRAVRTVRS